MNTDGPDGPPASHIHPSAFVASTAVILGDVTISELAVVMFGAVLRAELDRIVLGARTNVQDNAVIHCDAGLPTIIGRDTTIGHGAVVHGAVVGTTCLIGIGAMALNGSEMGDGSWLAAGSVLPEGRSIPPGMLGVGTPAKVLREVTPEEAERQRSGVEEYLRLGTMYRNAGHGRPANGAR